MYPALVCFITLRPDDQSGYYLETGRITHNMIGRQADFIFDIGLHQGEDAEFYLKKGYRVVGVEAVPRLAEAAAQRLKPYVDASQLVILNVAIAEQDGPLKFFENTSNSVWGTAYPDWAKRNELLGAKSVEITVQGRTFSSILREYGVPYYLKIDIEGADLLCLEVLRGFAEKPAHVSIESTKTSWAGLLREFALFESLGYSRYKVVPQHTVHLQQCPMPAKEGTYVDHHFEAGASGLFGEEAPGPWIDREEALKAYRSIFWKYRLLGDNGLVFRVPAAWRAMRRFQGWYDTHATL